MLKTKNCQIEILSEEKILLKNEREITTFSHNYKQKNLSLINHYYKKYYRIDFMLRLNDTRVRHGSIADVSKLWTVNQTQPAPT